MKAEAINCLKCKNYVVTWDNRFPRGCKLFGFKGTVMPAAMVFQSTGKPCQNFLERQSSGSKV
jgi:hypothetical protein